MTSAETKVPPFEVRHPFIGRFLIYPVICPIVSAIFLTTVYVLGGFKNGKLPEVPIYQQQLLQEKQEALIKAAAGTVSPIQAAAVQK